MIAWPADRCAINAAILQTIVCGILAGSLYATEDSTEAFDRIIPGWTNYSTAFNATHDTGPISDYATIASFYRPAGDVVPTEYTVIVIGGGIRPPNLSRFQFRVLIWDNLEAFIREPRFSAIATWDFVAATGGNPTQPDTITRGGRPAYLLRFALTNQPVVLSSNRDWVIGFAARGQTQFAGDLFVPTAPAAGPSDIQAGDIVTGGWRYLVDAGGSTIYSGELAVACKVSVSIERPRLEITRADSFVRLRWLATARSLVLETATTLAAEATWSLLDSAPITDDDGGQHVDVPATAGQQWFRLREDGGVLR